MTDHRSHSTPKALRCNCFVRHDPKCSYTGVVSRDPYVRVVRKLEIDSRPECLACHEPYELGTGLMGVCAPCRASIRVTL